MLTSVTSAGVEAGLLEQAENVEMVDRAERGRDLLALEALQVTLDDAGTAVGDEGERGIGSELGGVAAEVAEEHQVHAAQDGADGRHAGLHHVGLARLQRIERIDAGGVGARDGHVEPVFLEEAALDCDRQRQHVDGGHHADLEFYGILGLRQCQ